MKGKPYRRDAIFQDEFREDLRYWVATNRKTALHVLDLYRESKMTTATETLTIQIPVQAADRLRRVAEIAQRPIDEVVADTLKSTLPPLLDDLPPAFQADLAQLETWSNEALRQQVFAKLDPKKLKRYDRLLEKNQTGLLTATEERELNNLRTNADQLMFRKAYAALLLKWRGELFPTLADLEAAR